MKLILCGWSLITICNPKTAVKNGTIAYFKIKLILKDILQLFFFIVMTIWQHRVNFNCLFSLRLLFHVGRYSNTDTWDSLTDLTILPYTHMIVTIIIVIVKWTITVAYEFRFSVSRPYNSSFKFCLLYEEYIKMHDICRTKYVYKLYLVCHTLLLTYQYFFDLGEYCIYVGLFTRCGCLYTCG